MRSMTRLFLLCVPSLIAACGGLTGEDNVADQFTGYQGGSAGATPGTGGTGGTGATSLLGGRGGQAGASAATGLGGAGAEGGVTGAGAGGTPQGAGGSASSGKGLCGRTTTGYPGCDACVTARPGCCDALDSCLDSATDCIACFQKSSLPGCSTDADFLTVDACENSGVCEPICNPLTSGGGGGAGACGSGLSTGSPSCDACIGQIPSCCDALSGCLADEGCAPCLDGSTLPGCAENRDFLEFVGCLGTGPCQDLCSPVTLPTSLSPECSPDITLSCSSASAVGFDCDNSDGPAASDPALSCTRLATGDGVGVDAVQFCCETAP